ncbi:MAG: phosphatase PAP2 family protein [Gemmatimonadales bacterium]
MRGDRERRLRLRPIDWGVLGYLAVASAVAAARAGQAPEAAWTLVANALAATLVLLVQRPGLGRFGRTLRELYPLVLVVSLYGALDLVNGRGGIGIATHDRVVQRWEELLFGGQVSYTWWQSSPSRLWSTVLHAVYASYYPVVAAGPIWFLVRGQPVALRRVVATITVSYGLCFLVFLLYPVAGPNYVFPPPSPELLDNPAARFVYGLLERGSSYGAAFPSSHVAAALAAALVTWQGSRPLGFALLLPALILPVAVVYTQMHYAVDAVAGVVVGVIVAAVTSVRGEKK